MTATGTARPWTRRPRGGAEAASLAVFVTFALNGSAVGNWLARIPTVRDQLDLTPQQLGLILLVGASGSLVGLPLSGVVVQHLGARRSVQVFAAVNTVGLLAAAVGAQTGRVWLTAAGLALFGLGIGVWDAAMNLEGAAVEQQLGRSIMPRFHAGFSFGTMIGAGLAALATWLHASLVTHLSLALGVGLAGVIWATRWYLPEGTHRAVDHGPAEKPRSRFADTLAAWREPRTLLIGLIVLAAGLTEGAAGDWLSLAVVDGFDEPARWFDNPNTVGAIGYGLFVTAMTGMRLLGTGLLDRFGRVVVLRITAGMALTGVLVFGLVPSLVAASVGILLWGMGAALGFPVGLSAAADEPRMAPPRIAVVATIGYSSFLAGPPLLGMLADVVGYRSALLAVAVPIAIGLLVVPAAAPLRPAEADGPPAAN